MRSLRRFMSVILFSCVMIFFVGCYESPTENTGSTDKKALNNPQTTQNTDPTSKQPTDQSIKSKLKKKLTFETIDIYVVDEIIGEGGAGRVYGGVDSDHTKIALKVLAEQRGSTEKRHRFKNEIAFFVAQ